MRAISRFMCPGPESCQVVKNFPGESGDELIDRYPNYRMIFEPALGSKDARCPCETIDRCNISEYQWHDRTCFESPVSSVWGKQIFFEFRRISVVKQ